MFLGRIALFPIPGLKDIPTRNASIATFIDNENLSLNPLVISYQDENEVHFDSFTSCEILFYIHFFISNLIFDLIQLNEYEFLKSEISSIVEHYKLHSRLEFKTFLHSLPQRLNPTLQEKFIYL